MSDQKNVEDPIQTKPDPFTPELNEAQHRVVTFPSLERHLLVIAPPGSGKTLTITHRIAHLLANELAQPEQILALTFTARAANELVSRLGTMSLHGVAARTFHGHCSTVLRANSKAAGFADPFAVWTGDQQAQRVREASLAAGLAIIKQYQVSRLVSALSSWKCERVHIAEAAKESELSIDQFEAFVELYRRIQMDENAVDFDDLIIRTTELIWTDSEIAQATHSKTRFVFVDEFQDVSPEQLKLLWALAPPALAGRQVMAVADGNQAIFAFRGADPEKMLREYEQLYRPVRIALSQNRRSVGSIVEAAQALMQAVGSNEESEAFREHGLQIDAFWKRTDSDEAELVASLVERAVQHGRRYGDIAVLYRRHKRADLIESALLSRGIPVRRFQQARFYDHADVQETIRCFELVASNRDRSFVNAVNWPRFLVDELSMIALRRSAEVNGVGLAELAAREDLLRSCASPLTSTTVRRFFQNVVEPVRAMNAADPGVAIESILDRLERRRNPISAGERANFRATLDELGRGLEPIAESIGLALRASRPIRVLRDDGFDAVHAAELLALGLRSYFDADVSVEAGNISARDSDNEMQLHVSAIDDELGVFPLTARAYRLVQLLLMRHEHLHRGRFVVYDLETTSNRQDMAEILDIAAVVVENGKLTGETFHSLVRPSSPNVMTADAFNVHGLRWEEVSNAPMPVDVLQRFTEFVDGATLAGHNIQQFDGQVLGHCLERAGLARIEQPVLDTLLLARRLRPGLPNALDDLLTPDEKARRGQHGALVDAELTSAVLLRLMDMLKRDREIDVFSDALPVVAESICRKPGSRSADCELLRDCGVRGLAIAGESGPRDLGLDVDELLSVLALAETVSIAHESWQKLRTGWKSVVYSFRATAGELSLEAFMDLVALATPSDLEAGDTDRVSLMTVYSAKGHEWPVVFLIGLEDDQYPYSSSTRSGEVEEGRRSLYVGMTRATDRLILSLASTVGGKRREPSRFLPDLGESVIWHGGLIGKHD